MIKGDNCTLPYRLRYGTIQVIKGDNCTLPYRLRYGTIQVIKGNDCTFYAKNLIFAQNIL